MIIYGSRMYGVKNEVQGFGECEHCGVYGKHRSYQGRRFGHLYFIPLIPLGSTVRVMKECGRCKMGRQVPVEQVSRLYARIESLMQPCVLAAGEGRREFVDAEGETVACAPFLMDAIDLMFGAGYHGEIPGVLKLLDQDVSRYEHAIASGAYAELCGDTAACCRAFQAACEAMPDEALPYALLSDALMRAGKPAEALAMLERSCELQPGNVRLMLAKMNPLEAMGRYGELTALIDHVVGLEPALEQDKKIRKLRKKYAKKAAKAGQ